MPSGSKKRKAAKKKKENQPNSHQDPSSQSHGSDDGRHRDGKDSDVCEVSSPMASQDPHNQQNTSIEEGEEVIHAEKIVPTDGGVKIDAADKSVIAAEEVNVTSANREVGIEDDSSKEDVRLEHKEGATKGSCDGASSRSSSSSSSSRSSSDDESHGIKSSQAVEDIAPVVDSVTVTHFLSESKVETSDSVVPDKVPSLDQKVEVDINPVALSSVKSVVEETGEKETSCFEDKVIISTSAPDTALEPKEEATIHSIENISTISDPKEECVLQATDDQLIVSYNAPATIAENGANNIVDSGVTEPMVRTAPRSVQTTSWKSCCGLFEVFAGSRA